MQFKPDVLVPWTLVRPAYVSFCTLSPWRWTFSIAPDAPSSADDDVSSVLLVTLIGPHLFEDVGINGAAALSSCDIGLSLSFFCRLLTGLSFVDEVHTGCGRHVSFSVQ